MKYLRPIIIFPALFHLLFLVSSYAQDSGGTTERLDEIGKRVEEETLKLDEISSRSSLLEKELKRLSGAVDALRKEENKLIQKLDLVRRDKNVVEKELRETEEEIERLRLLSLQRFRVLYMHRKEFFLERVLFVKDVSEANRQALFLSKVREFDNKLIERLVVLKKEKEEKKASFEALVLEQEKLKSMLETKRVNLEGKASEKERVYVSIKEEKTKQEEYIASLKAQALRLETVVASLTSGERIEEEPLPKEHHKLSDLTVPFEGVGLAVSKSSLILPVDGKVLQNYGKHKPSDFEQYVFSKGVEFQATENSEIRAIAPGRVMFIGRMPGYGTVIILDHGKRYYSLYGRVGTTELHVGDIVEGNLPIGLVGPLDHRMRNFYFEIRQNGAPVNPKKFYGRKLD